MKLVRGLILILSGILLFGCYDKFHGPVIFNASDREIVIQIAVDDGPLSTTILKPEGKIWQSKQDAKITSLIINAGTVGAKSFTPQELSQFALAAKKNQILIWKIDGNELKAGLIDR